MQISQAQLDDVVAHAQADAPNECCGYMKLTDGRVDEVVRAENTRHSPYGYVMDPRALYAANELDDEGYGVAIYHSHPRSAPRSAIRTGSWSSCRWRASPRCVHGESSMANLRKNPSRSSEPLICPSCTRRYGPEARFCEECGMPLVQAGSMETTTPERERARKIDPRYAQGEPVRVAFTRNQAESDLVQNILLEEGIPSMARRTRGFDVPDFLAAGPRDVLVPESGAEMARALLRDADVAETIEPGGGRNPAATQVWILIAVLGGGVLAALLAWLLTGGSS
jgi:hypothetical protein